MFSINDLLLLANIALAGFLGFLIGLERKLRMKEAGIRTHTIVSIGASLIMVISMYGFGDNADSARLAAQIVSGVGFLGAGIIVYRQHEVKGLTTAAGIWATAGIGMACGASMYLIALGATAIIIVSQCVFRLNIPPFRNKKSFSIKIRFKQVDEANLKIKQIFGVDRFNHLIIERLDDSIIYSATLNTDKELSSSKLNDIICNNDFIYSIERCDNN
ncbi:MAG: MgtC/SapB family protein [Clostridia bacterium]|nr:MgtC/SapB family protein [Clostridia bacterium]